MLRGPLLNQTIIKCVVGTALQIDKSLTFVRGAQAACCFLRLIFDRWIKSFPTYSPVLRSPPPRHQTVSESRRQWLQNTGDICPYPMICTVHHPTRSLSLLLKKNCSFHISNQHGVTKEKEKKLQQCVVLLSTASCLCAAADKILDMSTIQVKPCFTFQTRFRQGVVQNSV